MALKTVMASLNLKTLIQQKARALPTGQTERVKRCQLALDEAAGDRKAGVGGMGGANARVDPRK